MEENRITEQSSAYDNLQRMSVHDILTGINREDARVHEAVRATIPVMERLVEQVVGRMAAGGRMFYIGAGTSGWLGVTDASELPPTYGVPFDTVIGLIAGGDGALRKAVVEGDLEEGCFLSGQVAAMVKQVQPAADIVREVMEGAEPVLKGATKWVK